jgi:uncharacterized protein with NRDE domain
MCTLVILRRPGEAWPVILGANRDEMSDRPWRPPARHWEDRPEVTAGLDELSGGSWMGVNKDGLVAAVLNRYGTLGPQAGKRSRGELVLEALDHAEAGTAALALADVNPAAYRGFNLVVADSRAAYWLTLRAEGEPVEVQPIRPGLSILTARELNDPESPRIARYRPLFEAAPPPEPEKDDWRDWKALLSSRDYDEEAGPGGAMAIDLGNGFRTVSSSLLALPENPELKPRWLFCSGQPDPGAYAPVAL